MLKKLTSFISEYFSTSVSAIGNRIRITTSRFTASWRRDPVNDWSRADYDFWRRAYRAQVRGLELSGLLIKPLVNKTAAWVMARPPDWKTDDEESGVALNDWWGDNHSDILKAYRESIKLGDAFLVVNPDQSLALIPPQNVSPIVPDNDYSQITGWRITQTYVHPDSVNAVQTVIDEYTAAERVRIIESNAVEVSRQTYPNLIGLVPVIHISNNTEAGETFGRPESEGLVSVLQRYGIIFEAAIEGNELQGRPTPVLSFESVSDLDKFWELYGESESQTLPDGTSETTTTLSVDLKQILTVSGATFTYQAPGAFVGEAQRLLELMFYLILEHTELPEFVFGNAVASSKASVETQMPVFSRFIEMKRGEAEKWLKELAEVVLGLLSLSMPGVTAQTPAMQWDELIQDNGQLTLQAVQWAFAEGLIDERTALQLLPVEIKDIETVLTLAHDETSERYPENRNDGQAGTAVQTNLEDEINKLQLEDVTND